MKTGVLYRLGFVALVACIPASCGYHDPRYEENGEDDAPPTDEQESALISTEPNWWKDLSQANRNQAILDRASRDIGKNVRLNCKQWVQLVVAEASRGAATVPMTFPDAYGWTWSQGPSAVRVSTDIRNVQPGWIVQMNRRTVNGGITPHTGIVVGRTAYGVYWVDSNYVAATTVGLHFETFIEFDRATYIDGVQRYSIYFIGN